MSTRNAKTQTLDQLVIEGFPIFYQKKEGGDLEDKVGDLRKTFNGVAIFDTFDDRVATITAKIFDKGNVAIITTNGFIRPFDDRNDDVVAIITTNGIFDNRRNKIASIGAGGIRMVEWASARNLPAVTDDKPTLRQLLAA